MFCGSGVIFEIYHVVSWKLPFVWHKTLVGTIEMSISQRDLSCGSVRANRAKISITLILSGSGGDGVSRGHSRRAGIEHTTTEMEDIENLPLLPPNLLHR